MQRIAIYLVLTSSVASCSHRGTQPHDMSVHGHEAAAEQLDAKAEAHEENYDPEATKASMSCTEYQFCWPTNPTEEHLSRARRLRHIAAEHREASQALRDAEAEACAGIAPDDRDISPFFHSELLTSIERHSADHYEISFQPLQGLTKEHLQRMMDCHMARNAALGYPRSDMTFCPLAAKGVDAEAGSEGDHLVVDLEVEDKASRDEVAWRIANLCSRSAQVEQPCPRRVD